MALRRGASVGDVASDESFADGGTPRPVRASTVTRSHELALSWLAGNPVVASVIAGATSPDQVRANARYSRVEPHLPEERAEVGASRASPGTDERAMGDDVAAQRHGRSAADVTAPAAGALVAELDRLAAAPPRALLVVARRARRWRLGP
jgi:hypothetical protein